MGFHIYGSKAAIAVDDQDRTRDNFHTIALEGSTDKRDRGFAWENKIVFQISREELPELLAVLMGWRARAQFDYHGAGRDKRLLVEVRDGGVFVALRQGEYPPAAVRAGPAERFHLAMTALRQLQRNYGGLSSDAVLAACRASFGTQVQTDAPAL